MTGRKEKMTQEGDPMIEHHDDLAQHRPTCLRDLKKGATVDGDSGLPPDIAPPWYDADRFAKIAPWFRKHSTSIVLAWHLSLIIGFNLQALVEALVHTGATSAPEDALERYISTFKHLLKWHIGGDIFTPGTRAYEDIQFVRKIHAIVRRSMEKKQQEDEEERGTGNQEKAGGESKQGAKNDEQLRKFLSAYDMATVQSGFMGAISTHPWGLGMRCTEAEIEDYCYYWRCVGYQLGIPDEYNLCGTGETGNDFEKSQKIVLEITQQVLEACANPPPHAESMGTAYVTGVNRRFRGVPLISYRSSLYMIFRNLDALDRWPYEPLTIVDHFRVLLLRFLIFCIKYVPFFVRFTAWLRFKLLTNVDEGVSGNINRTESGASAAGGSGLCPFNHAPRSSAVRASSSRKKKKKSS